MSRLTKENCCDIAVIGMSGRFPGANNINEFWQNIENGKESISFFSEAELQEQQAKFTNIDNLNFVPAKGYLENAEMFAADFFNIPERKAKIIDPQFRILLECVWHAWEDAGYNPFDYDGLVGVYSTSSSIESYYEHYLQNNTKIDGADPYEVLISNAKDFLATLIAYHFNFQGPCLNIQTACSSALVAITKACDDIVSQKIDTAVVGGVSITFPLKSGYIYMPGMIYSGDGHCCPFSEKASGVVPGNGAGVVILKSLKKAISDRDHIYAIIKGYAINNDGKNKLSYTAPSIKGQYNVLVSAAKVAKICPSTIGYIETHGTGTILGDQIEIAALKQYMLTSGSQKSHSPCYIGSVKANIGHLDVAAGIASFIKTVLAIKRKKIPPSINCPQPNPELKLEESQFQLSQKSIDWIITQESVPRRAGVSAFGIGGTNAHVILEEFSDKTLKRQATKQWNILPFSAKNPAEFLSLKNNLTVFAHSNNFNLQNIAYTLQTGRAHFKYRAAVISDSNLSLEAALYLPNSKDMIQSVNSGEQKKQIVFIISDDFQENIYGIKELYDNLSLFSAEFNKCRGVIKCKLNYDLLDIISVNSESIESDYSLAKKLTILSFQYAILKVLVSLGISSYKVIGYGFGKCIAKLIIENISFEEMVDILSEKIKFSENDKRIFVSALISESEFKNLIGDRKVYLFTKNTNNNLTIVGDNSAIQEFCDILLENGIIYQKNSNSFLGILDDHKTSSTQFYDDICQLLENECLYIEIGVSEKISKFIQQINQHEFNQNITVISSYSCHHEENYYSTFLYNLAKIWVEGIEVKWANLYDLKTLNLLNKETLPLYPFSRRPFLVDYHSVTSVKPDEKIIDIKSGKMQNPLYTAAWIKRPGFRISNIDLKAIILVHDKSGFSSKLYVQLKHKMPGARIIEVPCFSSYCKTLAEEDLLIRAKIWLDNLKELNGFSDICIIHSTISQTQSIDSAHKDGLYDLLAFERALTMLEQTPFIHLFGFTNNSVKIKNEDILKPEKTCIFGPIFCFPVENYRLKARCIDINTLDEFPNLINLIIHELKIIDKKPLIALRAGERYAPSYNPLNKVESLLDSHKNISLKENGVYLITGGLGGIGLVLAEHMAKNYRANLILVSRTKIPNEEHWDYHLAAPNTADKLKIKLRALKNLKLYASSLQIFSADVSSYNDMRHVLQQARGITEKINGVIHAAAISEGLAQRKNLANIKSALNAKIFGMNVLMQIFQNQDLDFMVLCSALNTIRGGVGVVSYVAANAYLNASAQSAEATCNFPVIAINWDAWSETGMRFEHLNRKNNVLMNFDLKTKRDNQSFNIDNKKWWPYIEEHKLNNKIIIPSCLLIELCIHIQKNFLKHHFPMVISDFSFLQPSIVKDINDCNIVCILDENNHSLTIENRNSKLVKKLSQAIITQYDANIETSINQNIFKIFDEINFMPKNLLLDPHHDMASFKPRWTLDWVKKHESIYLAKISLLEAYDNELEELILHPSLLDITLCYHSRFLSIRHSPFFIQSLRIYRSLPKTFYSVIKIKSQNETAGTCTSNIIVFNLNKEVILEATGFILKRIDNTESFLREG